MIRSFLRLSGPGSFSVFQRRRRHAQRRRRKPLPLAVQSLEPRLALAVGVGGDSERESTLRVDTAPPAIQSIAAPKGQTYGEGGTIAFRVNFTEPVIATGVPALPITVGDTVREAVWNGRGSGSKSLTFTLTVRAGDSAPAGVRVAGPIVLSDGAAIRDRAGNDLNPAASGEFPRARVDAVGPSVSDFGRIAIAGKRVSMRVTFTEPVTVRGKPSISCTLDGEPRQLVYVRRSSPNVLVFRYKPTRRETPTVENVVVSTPVIALNRGGIIDRAGNVAASLAQPTEIGFSAASLPENQPAGTVVGVLSAVDTDGARDRHTFALIEGPGSTDNATFEIIGNKLRTVRPLNHESQASYSVRVRSTDSGGLSLDKVFALTVSDVNEAPAGIALANTTSSLTENTSTANRIKVAEIVITDDALGTNTVTLTGADSGSFEVDGLALFLKSGVSLDFETKQSCTVTVSVADASLAGGTPVTAGFTLTVTDVNDVVPVFTSGPTGSVAENAPISTAIYTAVTTDADGTVANRAVAYSIKPNVGDADFVQIDATTGVVALLASADFEAKPSYAFTVVATNVGTGATLVTEQAVAVAVSDVNEAPTGVALTTTTSNLPENTSTATRIKVADIVVADDALGTNSITLTGADAARFEVDGLALYLKSGVSLDYETKTSYAVTANVADTLSPSGTPVAVNFTLTVTDVNETPTDITLAASSIAEGAGTNAVVGTFTTSGPDATSTSTYVLVAGAGSTDNASFNILGNQLRATASLDFETQSSYSVRVRSTDQGGLSFEKTFTITVSDVNEAPTSVALTNTTSSLPENTSTASRIKVADIVIADDALGTNTVTLSGTDSGSFEIDGLALFLKSSVALDFEAKQSYAVTVNVADASVAGSTSVTVGFTVTVTDTNEDPTDITLSATSIAEDSGANAVVGALSTVDPDAGNTFTYTLVSGTGSTDNASFNISGNQLRATASLDFETQSSYSVRVRSTDQGGLSFEKTFTITVTDLAVELAFVTVGDPGNTADTSPAGYGAVTDSFQIMTFEFTNLQYAAFLNSVAATDTYSLYSISMEQNARGGITQSGTSGSYTYSVKPYMGDKPVNYVSWFDAARVANWLHNGQGSGSTETGAYTLGGATSGGAVAVNPGAMFYIPTENQWYKAAYYRGGSTNAGYWDYATQSDTIPTGVTADTTGIGSAGAIGNFANYSGANWNGPISGNVTTVGTNGGPSFYGAFDMTGNVFEWTDLNGAAGLTRVQRGGSWGGSYLSSSGRVATSFLSSGDGSNGFRLARPVADPNNRAPTDITLSATSIAENAGANAVVGTVGTVDPDATNTFTYALVTGTGSTDNGSFNISGNQLRATASLDFETQSSYSVRVRAFDQGGLFTEKAFTITATDANETPTDITLSATSIAENAGANAVVGTFTTTDPDATNTFTYTLVTGTGSTDNASFNISGNQLRATASLDFETQSSYSVRVRSTDQGGLSSEKTFTITVTDLAVEIAFVTVGDIGNANDPATGNLYGAVNYQYQIGAYEVTIGQYTAFLNAVAADDPYGLYNTNMATDLNVAGISRAGSAGSYTYSVIAPAGVTTVGADSPGNRPITYVSWFDAARFANWMHNGQGSGSTETGAYTISTGVITAASRTSNVNTYTLAAPSTLSVGDQVSVTGLSDTSFNLSRLVTSVSGLQFTMDYDGGDATATGTGSMTGASATASVGALYRLPTENEWYKAAYYSPVKGGAGSPGYYVYATQSDSAPGNTIGNGANQANYYAGDYTVTQSTSSSSSQNYLTNVGAFTNSTSYYGTYDQSGNVYEWNEVIFNAPQRGLRGGNWWDTNAFGLSSSRRLTFTPSSESYHIGFRLASPG